MKVNKEFKNLITKYPPSVSKDEAEFLLNVTKSIPEQGVILEIGSYKGGSAILLAKGSMENKKGKVYTIDPNINNLKTLKENIKKAKMEDWIIPITKTSEKAAKYWKKPISFLWIDGNHDYPFVKMDFLLWEKYLIKGGIISFHDSCFSGKKVLSKGVPLHSFKFLGPKKVVREYILNSRRFKNVRIIDSTTYARKIKNARISERIKIRLSIFFEVINKNLERYIGKLNIFLKKYLPNLHFFLKN